VTEEAIWTVTNLSMLAPQYEEDFMSAVVALLQIMECQKMDNLNSLLNLKQ